MLIPITCPVCGAVGAAPCARCRAALRRAPSLPRPDGVVSCRAVLDYEGVGRELVARVKYRNARSAVPFLGAAMATLVDRATVDAVTWAPTTARRRRQRGYDHAQLLARVVARRMAVPCVGLLRRRPGPPQTGRPLAQRRSGPGFVARRSSPARVLLIDDVVTSGATVSAAARALRAAGAQEVHVLAAARTGPKVAG